MRQLHCCTGSWQPYQASGRLSVEMDKQVHEGTTAAEWAALSSTVSRACTVCEG